ncbi:hypothetical protein D3C85_1430130 [compost metagenome]
MQEFSLSLRVLLKLPTTLKQSALSQQSASALLETREEKELLYVLVFHRGQTVTADHPVLGTQVVEVHPQRSLFPFDHGIHIGARQLAGECSNHHIGGFSPLPLGWPLAHFDALLPLLCSVDVDWRTQALERSQIIDP